MGLMANQLSPGSYYEGHGVYRLNGTRVFAYVETLFSTSTGDVEVQLWLWNRDYNAVGWQLHTATWRPDEDTHLGREATDADLAAEKVPACPGVAGGSKGSTPIAKASDRNQGKQRIPENADRLTCARCGGDNKGVPLFRFTTYFCPTCEPV